MCAGLYGHPVHIFHVRPLYQHAVGENGFIGSKEHLKDSCRLEKLQITLLQYRNITS